ncbi:hypothetical protein ABB02_01503 [Clostridiaceae bacterium JG1575]|nr:hypothetical protein ABB02_01503 [Clostridiaceae bacterium JG1575]
MPTNIEMDHITIIVPQGKGEDVLRTAKQKGIPNGTVSQGYGTANEQQMKESEAHGLVRDIVSIVAATDMAEIFLKKIAEELGLGKPGHGIAYAVNVNDLYTERLENMDDASRNESEVQVITSIIRHGHSESIMDAARSAGARGGTLLRDKAGMDPESSLFSKGTEGDDEIVLIISRKETVKPIMEAIRERSGMDAKTGVMYVQDAHFVYGLKK